MVVLGLFGFSLLISLLAYGVRKLSPLMAVVLVLLVVVPLVSLAIVFGQVPR